MSEQPTPSLPRTHTAPHERAQALPQRLRRNVATLSLVGAVLVALPVVQLLRYQSAELETLNTSRAKLDPVARAVHVQRGLLAHRDISAQVLGGRAALEPERQTRQSEVDGRLAAMMVALASGRWELAMGEADELHQDWRALVQQIGSRSIDSRSSDQAHRLLVEQTLQVVDLLAIASHGEPTHGASLIQPQDVPQSTLTLVQTLPRLVWQTSLLGEPAPEGQSASHNSLRLHKAAQIEAGLGRLLGQLETPHLPPGADMATSPAVPAASETVLRAGAAAGAATARFVSLLQAAHDAPDASAGATAADIQHAGRAAIQAQMQLFDVAEGSAQAALAAHSRQIAQRRALLMGGLTFLALLAAALLSRIWRGLLLWQDREREQEAARPLRLEDSAGQEPAERRAQTDRLLQRLRDGGTPEVATPHTAETQTVATQPPPSKH